MLIAGNDLLLLQRSYRRSKLGMGWVTWGVVKGGGGTGPANARLSDRFGPRNCPNFCVFVLVYLSPVDLLYYPFVFHPVSRMLMVRFHPC